MGQNTSMGTSIIVLITVTAITDGRRSGMNTLLNIGVNFTGKRCMMRTGMRLHTGTRVRTSTGKPVVEVMS